MKSRIFAAVLFLAVAVAAPAEAIINGQPDGDAHPNVGLLAFDPDGEGGLPPIGWCTGSVLADDVFLTAAHCITAPFIPPGSQWVVTLKGGGPGDTVADPGFFPDDFPFEVTVPMVRSTGVAVHPKFDPASRRHDVAVVLFPEGTFEDVVPVSLPSIRQLDRLLARDRLDGLELTLVGYGAAPVFGQDPIRLFVPGFRQVGSAPFEGLSGHSLFLLVTERAVRARAIPAARSSLTSTVRTSPCRWCPAPGGACLGAAAGSGGSAAG
jgi:hypothetical protein